MDVRSLFPSLGSQARQGRRENSSAYSLLPMTPTAVRSASLNDGSRTDDISPESYHSDHQLRTMVRPLSRLLADFTLGFADGLTVPFALTAGLSSLGQIKTVIYAGMAEICAGCISMGIGGYLAAKGEESAGAEDKNGGDEEKPAGNLQDSVEKYLAPLCLPPDLLQSVMSHVTSPGAPSLLLPESSSARDVEESRSQASSPCCIGLSISLGYLLGGLLPLLPYFFVNDVARGLQWSFCVCVVALFLFGFVKDYLLQVRLASEDKAIGPSARWRRVRHSILEGMRMVVLGGLAAITAVLCVRVFEGIVA
ncbi:VIT family-domain-containing protein [Biscogniauxia marginata]|nr:VIT family-domain-containing protein [Biscogniauxia marginata]